jgi:hypothetical protein
MASFQICLKRCTSAQAVPFGHGGHFLSTAALRFWDDRGPFQKLIDAAGRPPWAQ